MVDSVAKNNFFFIYHAKAKNACILRLRRGDRNLERETFMRFSIIRRLLTAIRMTIHRLRRPAWLCN